MAPRPDRVRAGEPRSGDPPRGGRRASAAVIATGRSDYPNQINNVLCFPGIFRGALDAGATTITEGMKLAAAEAIAAAVGDDELAPDYVVPSVFDKRVSRLVADASAGAAVATTVSCAPVFGRDLSADAVDAVTFDYWNTLVSRARYRGLRTVAAPSGSSAVLRRFELEVDGCAAARGVRRDGCEPVTSTGSTTSSTTPSQASAEVARAARDRGRSRKCRTP